MPNPMLQSSEVAMRFLPREEKFFALFLDQVRYIGEAAVLLLQGVEGG